MTEPNIACPRCGMTSHNPNDVRERYCGNCRQYHADMPPVHTETGFLAGIADMTLDLEAEHHDEGWDNTPPTVYVACREQRPDAVIQVVPCRLGLSGQHPRRELYALSQVLDHPRYAGAVAATLPPGAPVATVLVTEAWINSLAEEERAGRNLADIPGSQECRVAYTVCGKHRMMVTRIRGKAPVYSRCGPDEMSGVMYDDLVAYHKALRHAYAMAHA